MVSSRISSVLFALAAVSAAAATPLHPLAARAISSAPPEANATLIGMTYSGNGCPPDTVRYQFVDPRPDYSTIQYDSFSARIGPNVSVTENRKTCQLSLEIKSDPNWEFIIGSSDTIIRGSVSLDLGVTASLKATYTTSRNYSNQTVAIVTIVGPVNSTDYTGSDSPPTGTGAHSPCGGGTVVSSSQMRLTSTVSGASGFFGPVVDLDPHLYHTIFVVWQKCSRPNPLL